MKLSKTILAVALGSILASHAFADDKAVAPTTAKNDTENSSVITNNDLSKITMEQKKLEKENAVAQSKLSLLKTQQEIMKVKEETGDGGFSGGPNEMKASDEQRLSEEQGIPQNVGFIYKNDKKAKLTEENSEMNTILQEFNALKQSVAEKDKKEQEQQEAAKQMVSIKSLESVEIDRLSIYGEVQKSARLRFVYLITEGPTQKRVATKVDVKEGSEFKVQGDTYKVVQIGTEGITIQNTVSKKNIDLARSQ